MVERAPELVGRARCAMHDSYVCLVRKKGCLGVATKRYDAGQLEAAAGSGNVRFLGLRSD